MKDAVKQECIRFKGVKNPETLACEGIIPELLGCGGWTIKAMAMAGEKDGLALQKLGGAVLGSDGGQVQGECVQAC